MKKLITSFFMMFVLVCMTSAQISWDQVKHSTTETPQADTAYFSIICRGGGFQALAQTVPGVLYAEANPGITNFAPGDSLIWHVEKGASAGTSPRVRFVNVATGEYLYMGLKGGEAIVAYMGPKTDPFGGEKDFFLYDMGPRVAAEYYYSISDSKGNRLGNNVAGAVNLALNLTSAPYQWRFNKKMGPQPKATPVNVGLELTTVETSVFAGGNVNLNVKVTKGSSDLLGLALIYHGSTLLDTLELNASGEATYLYEGLVYGEEKFALVYTGDQVYTPSESIITLNVGPDPSAAKTKVAFTLPESAKVYDEVEVNISITTEANVAVEYGSVFVMVDSVVKNVLELDVLGTASLTFPNLVETSAIKVFYLGDKMAYLDSDTLAKSITINPHQSTVLPYPVTFNLTQYPEIDLWTRENVTPTTTRPYTYTFSQDSLPGIKFEMENSKVTYQALAHSAAPTNNNYYVAADNIWLPLGSGRSKWVSFKTPWLNEGSYNIYFTHRHNTDFMLNFTSVTLDGKELYFPNKEMNGRWLRSWATSNNKRRWNAVGHHNDLPMKYIGSVKIDGSGTHELKITVKDENGVDNHLLDLLQFVPVDQDAWKVNQTAAVAMAQIYYPLFDLGGFPRYEGETPISTFAGVSEMAVPYQAVNPTTYTKTSHTLTGLGVTPTADDLIGNYVTIYRNEDKWTRMAEGYLDESTSSFTAELPNGTYYYQEIFHYDPGTTLGAYNTRYFISDGTFSVGGGDDVEQIDRSTAYAYALGNTLNIKGMKEGSKVYVVDIAGRVITNETVNSNTYSKNLPKGMYIVKVVGAESLLTKVIVQ